MPSNVVSLIPKIPRVDSIKNCRPIVVVNFLFKIISKILGHRLVSIASRIMSSNQYEFLQDKHIQDCICVTFLTINILYNKVKGGSIAFMIDIQKDFYILNWDFL